MSRAKVLVVDDDPITLQVLRERLQNAGFEVLVRDQALGTSQAIVKHRPHIVLLDVMMPALSGDELATLLGRSALTKDARIILHSSKPIEELLPLIQSTGAVGVISKTSDDARFLREFERLAGNDR